ncbi:MAG TPA: hypothetical protein VEW45_02450, partial [Candidatus Dormibacteraeota bacterium]|nr:hypothetical protein [Candidatus Dormibacteraeota bacterium]
MNRFRTHWLALLGGGLLLALSISSAFGAKPDSAPAAQPETQPLEVSTAGNESFVSDNEFAEEENVENEGADEAEDVDDGAVEDVDVADVEDVDDAAVEDVDVA